LQQSTRAQETLTSTKFGTLEQHHLNVPTFGTCSCLCRFMTCATHLEQREITWTHSNSKSIPNTQSTEFNQLIKQHPSHMLDCNPSNRTPLHSQPRGTWQAFLSRTRGNSPSTPYHIAHMSHQIPCCSPLYSALMDTLAAHRTTACSYCVSAFQYLRIIYHECHHVWLDVSVS
jgi:hypothetical protein